ncbi:MAG: cation diffusion facilitator family transporter, partial [Verrucomicrobiota bacterium]
MQAGLAVTWLSLVVNVVLGTAKGVIGFMVNSTALMADGLHSLVDLSTDVAALFGLKMAAIPRDENHPYGHHRYASLSTLFIGCVLVGFCIWLIYASITELVDGALVYPEWPALLIAGASIIIKEGLYWRTRAIARQQ